MDKGEAIEFIKTNFDVIDLWESLIKDGTMEDCIVLDDDRSMVCTFSWEPTKPEQFEVSLDPTWWEESFEFTLTFEEIGA